MKISVIIPVYNAEKYVTQAVESALQFDEVFEIILIEDKSPDNALQVCRELDKKYSRVKLYQHLDKGNHGAGASRNLGITMAEGDFIAFLDADDYYLPNRFDAEKKLFKDPKIESVYGALGVHYYSEKARNDYHKVFGDRLTTVYEKHDPKDVFTGLLGMKGSFGLIHLDTLTIRKNALNRLDSFFKKSLRLHQDTEFIFRLSFCINLYPGILDQAIAIRGVHENNRITKVETKKINPATTRVLLWKEVNEWAKNENTIPQDTKLHIRRMHRSYEIAIAPIWKKWGMIIKYLFTDYKSIRSGLYNINFREDLF